MRVIHFVPYVPPDRVGGVGEFAVALHRGLLRRGVASEILTSGHGSAEGVYRIARSRLGWLVAGVRWVRHAAACDVAHFQSGEALAALLGLALWPGRRARILVTFHVSSARMQACESAYQLEGRQFRPARPLSSAFLGWLHRAADAMAWRLADGTSAVCRATASDVDGPAFARSCRVIHNGVATAPAPPDRDLAPVDLLYVGIASHRKRILALPFVLRRVRERVPDARLRIVGFDLGDAVELEALLRELGLLSHVEFAGRVAPHELDAHYRAARLLLVPSAYEGLPYVILEALRCGTPVVATRTAGHPEAIEDGVNGLLVPIDEPAALAERCIGVLCDPELAARLSAAGRDTIARRFDLEREIDAYLDYYRALVGEAT